jgi:hypothetical protein
LEEKQNRQYGKANSSLRREAELKYWRGNFFSLEGKQSRQYGGANPLLEEKQN